MSSRLYIPIALIGALLSVAVGPAHGAGLTPLEEQGRQIYLTGKSPFGERIWATIGDLGTRVPGTAVPCGNCHGPDGQGRPEGGVVPPNITWRHLTKSYGHRHPTGRDHPAFDAASFARAVTERRDPAGNPLESAMPMFEMSPASVEALIAYLGRLGNDHDPGLAAGEVTFATLLPSTGPQADLGQSVRAVLEAYFAEINATGGVFGRRLRLRAVEPSTARPGPVLAAEQRQALAEGFAVLSPLASGAEAELSDLAEDEALPLVGPLTLRAGDPDIWGDAAFFPLPGLQEQARALVEHAAADPEVKAGPPIVVVGDELAEFGLTDAIKAQAKSHGWGEPVELRLPLHGDRLAQRVGELAATQSDTVFFFGGPQDLTAFAASAEAAGWRPRLFLSGMIAGRALFRLPGDVWQRVTLAYPTVPSSRNRAGFDAFLGLLAKYKVPRRHLPTQLAAFVSAKVLVEGMRRSGRKLSRAKFTESLEGLLEFETGVTATVSFGRNRRVGALGAHIVQADLMNRSFVDAGAWVSLD